MIMISPLFLQGAFVYLGIRSRVHKVEWGKIANLGLRFYGGFVISNIVLS
jgi:hypothetical protein